MQSKLRNASATAIFLFLVQAGDSDLYFGNTVFTCSSFPFLSCALGSGHETGLWLFLCCYLLFLL